MKKKKLFSFLLAGADLSAFVALDTRITEIPAWLSGWTKTADTLADDGFPTQFALICISLTYK